MKDFIVYANGLVHCSVCSSLPEEDVVLRVNIANPTGVTPWRIVEEKFKTGEPNPCPCDKYPDTHKHYLFTC